MPPILALLLCSLFVVFLLRFDHRVSKQSWVIWIPTIWVMRCASLPFNVWFSLNDFHDLGSSMESGNPVDRNVLTILIVLALVTLVKRGTDLGQVVKDNKWLVILFGYMLVSTLWSDFFFVSTRRWVKVSGNLVMALVVITEASPMKAVDAVLRRTVYVGIPFSLLLIKYYPALGVDFGRWDGAVSWAGVTPGKNTLGLLCMISILVLARQWANRSSGCEQQPTRLETTAIFGVLAITLLLLRGPGGGYSATSVITLVVGLLAYFSLRALPSVRWALVMCGTVMVTAVGSLALTEVLFGATPIEIVAPLVGRNTSLTGRTDQIWEPLLAMAWQQPLTGRGYGGYWVFPMMFDKFSVNQAHNGYIDIFIELGAIGLALFALVIVEFFRKALREFGRNPDWGAFLLTFLLISLLHNYTESSYLKTTAFLWSLFIFLTFAMSWTREERHKTAQPVMVEAPENVRERRNWPTAATARTHG